MRRGKLEVIDFLKHEFHSYPESVKTRLFRLARNDGEGQEELVDCTNQAAFSASSEYVPLRASLFNFAR